MLLCWVTITAWLSNSTPPFWLTCHMAIMATSSHYLLFSPHRWDRVNWWNEWRRYWSTPSIQRLARRCQEWTVSRQQQTTDPLEFCPSHSNGFDTVGDHAEKVVLLLPQQMLNGIFAATHVKRLERGSPYINCSFLVTRVIIYETFKWSCRGFASMSIERMSFRCTNSVCKRKRETNVLVIENIWMFSYAI